jgi:hypothetical protein
LFSSPFALQHLAHPEVGWRGGGISVRWSVGLCGFEASEREYFIAKYSMWLEAEKAQFWKVSSR